ncbi:MAG: START domain-containing protein [Bdellovibrionia bacterium]
MDLKILYTGLIVFVAMPLSASVEKPNYISLDDKSWAESGEGDGIRTFKKELENDPIVGLRGQGVIDAPIAKVAQVIFDTARSPEWIDSLADARVVKKVSDYEQVTYSHISTPPIILKDREFLTNAKVHYYPKEKTIHVTLEPADDSLVPPTRYIRGTIHGGFLLKPIENGQKTFLVTEMHGDPKGDVPKWIVNMFQTGWAKNTIERIRKQVKKPGIIEDPRVLEVMQKGEAIL